MTAALLIAAGPFLSFVMQPMAAKALLPVFGGAAAVWTAVLLFFQTSFVAGYAYAHCTRRRAHAVLVIASAAAAAVAVPGGGFPSFSATSRFPAGQVFWALTASIGLPCLVLAATSPLWQRWLGGSLPYRYYAWSNAASLAGLLAYPVLIEPLLDLDTQFRLWRAGFAGFAGVSLLAVWRTPHEQPPAPNVWRQARPVWWAAPAVGTLLLGSATNQLCQEVAPAPFLWVAPLALYLMSFMVVFHRLEWRRGSFLLWAAALLIPASCLLLAVGLRVSFAVHLGVHLAALLVCFLLCHGELALARPEPARLTLFYLCIAAGGAFGGLLAAILAPLVFHSYAEFPIALGLTALLALVRAARKPQRTGLALAALTCVITLAPGNRDAQIREQRRTFFGVLRVTERNGIRKMTHGSTTHGSQFLDATRRYLATTYYGPQSGAALAIERHPQRNMRPLRIGIIGLGAGTLSVYGRKGDQIHYLELDPEVERLARQWFTYLRDSEASVQVSIGDARVHLSRLPPQQFDALIIDAFASDAIPTHLLTVEAGQVYARHLAPHARMAFHISNLTLNLEPVVAGLARQLGFRATRIATDPQPASGLEASTWMVLDADAPPAPLYGREVRWTDRHAAVWPLLGR